MSVSLCGVRKALELTQNLYPGFSTGEGHVMSEYPGSLADRPPVAHHGGVGAETEGGDVVKHMELTQDLSESLLVSTSSPVELNEEETQGVDSSWNQDGELPVCGQWVFPVATRW